MCPVGSGLEGLGLQGGKPGAEEWGGVEGGAVLGDNCVESRFRKDSETKG